MSLPFFHKNHTHISNYLDFPGELLNSPTSSRDCILIAGPDLVRWEVVHDQGHTDTYLERLLKGMVVWCTQNKVIQDQDVIQDLHVLLHNGALIPLAYNIEEYLAAAQLKEQCLRAVLNCYGQVEAIHYQLTRFPFRGYITTSYDTCIETAYSETQKGQLGKFYQSSLANTVDACRKKQPFILKLYGDLAESDSIKLGHRLLTGLYAEDVRQQLGQLFLEAPAIFIGFDDADRDLPTLRSLVTDRHNGQQKHSTQARKPHDGIITKPADQSSLDSTVHEFSPGDCPPGPIISSQSQNIASKDEQPEKAMLPDTTRPETISIPAFAEGQQKRNNSTSTRSSQLSSGPSAGLNGQTPNQTSESRAENSEQATGSHSNAQVPDFESLVKSGDLQLPNDGVVGNFKSFLRNECADVSITVNNEPGTTPYTGMSKKYTHLTKGQDHHYALIYIPGPTIAEPDEIQILVIRGICSAFSSHIDLIICTDSDDCHPELNRNLAEFKQQNREKKCKLILRKDIQYILGCKNAMNKETKAAWIDYILSYS